MTIQLELEIRELTHVHEKEMTVQEERGRERDDSIELLNFQATMWPIGHIYRAREMLPLAVYGLRFKLLPMSKKESFSFPKNQQLLTLTKYI